MTTMVTKKQKAHKVYCKKKKNLKIINIVQNQFNIKLK